jgi:hypothetical protein
MEDQNSVDSNNNGESDEVIIIANHKPFSFSRQR